MARRPALHALASRLGILPGYHAIDGTWRPTPDAAREALLSAMGFQADTEADARRALEALGTEERERLLAPTQVLRDGDRRLPLPARARPARTVRYELVLEDETGRRLTDAGSLRARAGALRLPRLEPGRYRLELRLAGASGAREAQQFLIVAPATCVAPRERLGRRRVFGLWCNLYALRGPRALEAGVGDLGTLRALVRRAARTGGAFVGVNPLHALRNRPPEVSPYGPVSRLFRNPLYLDLEAIPELRESRAARSLLETPAAQAELDALQAGRRIDYARAWAWKRRVLEALHATFVRLHGPGETPRGRAYRRYLAREGERLRDFATFSVLEEALARRGHARDWRAWPRRYRSPASPALEPFRRSHARAADFHRFLQFELDRQLASVAAEGRRRGLALGLYQDLALGSAASGFDTWSFPDLFLPDLSVGAPPDDYSATGQSWGFPPLSPHRLRATGYRFWELVLRAGFAHAGALRIDHVLGLFRQFWVPEGESAAEGAYIRFPAEELLAVLALESRRAGAVVVGEDLGTVPRGLPARLARAGVLSSSVLLFERDRRGGFRPVHRYPSRALVTANTHDHPTLAGYVAGRDLELRSRVGEIEGRSALARARAQREQECRRLADRLVRSRLLAHASPLPPYEELCTAIYAFLARTPSPLLGLSIEDLAAEPDPVNLPGIPFERYPSWTRRLEATLDAIFRSPVTRRTLDGVRGRARRG